MVLASSLVELGPSNREQARDDYPSSQQVVNNNNNDNISNILSCVQNASRGIANLGAGRILQILRVLAAQSARGSLADKGLYRQRATIYLKCPRNSSNFVSSEKKKKGGGLL